MSIRQLINWGITPNTASDLNKCIRLANASALILGAGLVPYLLLYWYYELAIAFSAVFFLFLFNLSVPYLNRIGFNRFSRTSFMILNYSLGFLNSTLLGESSFLYLYLIVGLPASVMLFHYQEYRLQALSLGTALLLIVLDLIFKVEPLSRYDLPATSMSYIQTTVVIGALSCAVVFILFLRHENNAAQRSFEQLIVNELALKEAKDKAEEAAKVKANFLATMSHEIRTPLNGVIGMAQLLLEDNPKSEQIESLKILKFAGENLLSLINDVLDFSKIDAGRITLETVPFCLSELLHSIENSSRHLAAEKDIEFTLLLDDQLAQHYQGDPVRLTQVLLNLTSNAIKFTSEGRVSLMVSVVRDDQNTADIEFKVIDTGVGIATDKLAHIFEQFSQADSSITRNYGGSGLGLSITKGLLEAFGSDINVESEEGKGSTFSFILTMQKATKEHYLLPSNPLRKSHHEQNDIVLKEDLKGLSILVAEDNPVNVMVVQKWLTKWEVAFDIVKNGEEAVSKIHEKQYDLVLMDIHMPVMDGFQATLAIRSLMKGAPLPIIALTATTTDEFVAKAYQVGMSDYLGKPFNPSHLKTKIKQLCTPVTT